MPLRQLYDRLRRKHQQVKLEPGPFKLIKGQKTLPPIVVPYPIYGHGTLAATADKGFHYAKLRAFIGRSDPVLSHLVPNRQELAHDLAAGERREIERALWENLFRYPPTHVIHVGWVSHTTGVCHPIIRLPLNFIYPGFNANGLAKESVSYMVDWMQRCDDRPLLLPTDKIVFNPITNTKRSGTHFAAAFWLVQLFYHYKELTVERPARRWL